MSLVQLLVKSASASVILTFRLGETMAPELHGLWKDELIDRIDLEPLKRDEVEQRLASVTPATIQLPETLPIGEPTPVEIVVAVCGSDPSGRRVRGPARVRGAGSGSRGRLEAGGWTPAAR